MSNQIDNKLFLYNAEGRVIGVKKGSEEAIQATKKEYRKEQGTEKVGDNTYILFEKNVSEKYTLDELAKKNPNALTSRFLEGNLTVSQFIAGMAEVGITATEEQAQNGKTIVSYTDNNGKKVTLKCSTEAAKSQTDSKTQTVVKPLSGLSQDDINRYYEAVRYENGVAQEYVMKTGYTEAKIQSLVNNKKSASASSSTSSSYTSKVSSQYMYVVRNNGSNEVTNVVPNPNKQLTWKEQCDTKKGVYGNLQERIFKDGRSNDNGAKYVSVEELTVEQLVSLFQNSSGSSQISTEELKKGLKANGISNFEIKTTRPDGYSYDVQILKFTDKTGKTYDLKAKSYENACAYENDLTTRTGGAVLPQQAVDKAVHVSSAQQLQSLMTTKPDSIIILDNDIDLSGINWTPIEEFSGAICGQGHTIKNLTVTTDEENAGFIGTLTGIIADVTFENAKIVNSSGEQKSSSGVVAGKMDVKSNICGRDENYWKEYRINVNITYDTKIVNVDVKNSTVNGGVKTGGIVGDAVCENSSIKGPHIKDSTVSNCDITGSYAVGGVAGQTDSINIGVSEDNYALKMGAAVKDSELNDGVFIGGKVGSADNTTATGGGVKNVTINGKEDVTLGAGGVYGRTDTPSEEITNGDVTIYNAYASGTKIGWCCEVDPETGKVTKDCDVPLENVKKGQIGRAGTTTDEVMKVNAGQYINIDEYYADIDSFAQINNLSHYKNFEHVYQDSKGNLYWNNSGSIMCNTFVNAIDAYKTMKSKEMESHGASISMVYFGGDLEEDKVYAMSGYCDPYNPGLWDVKELFSGLEAVEIYGKRDMTSIYNQDGLIYGKDVPYEYCYKTADGQWHKLTMSTVGAYDKDGNDAESIIYDYNSVKDYINQHLAKSVNELDKLHYFAVEDITAEEAMETFGALTGQPPHNQGFVNDGLDGYVEEVKAEKETDLTGITKVETPANATLKDYQDMLVLTNFLKADIYSGIVLDSQIDTNSGKYVLGKFDKKTGEYKGVFSENPEIEYHMIHGAYNSYNQVSKEPYKYESVDHFDVGQTCPDDESCYVDWYYIEGDSGDTKTLSTLNTIGGKVELTEDNLEYYKDKIQFYDKEQLVEKALEKLINESWKIRGQQDMVNPCSWVTSLVSALGGTVTDWIPGGDYDHGFGSDMYYGHISFSLNGHTYDIPISGPTAKIYDDSQIITKEEAETWRQYLGDDLFNETFNNMNPTDLEGSQCFTPLVGVDGKVQSWLYIGNLASTQYNISQSTRQKGVYNSDTTMTFDAMTEWLSTHDYRGMSEYNPNTRFMEYSELKGYNLSDEVVEYYFSVASSSGTPDEMPTSDMCLTYRNDLDIPVFTNVDDFRAYVKSHDLNSEFATAKAKKAQSDKNSETNEAAKKSAEEKAERESYSEEFIEKFAKQLDGDAASQFTSLVSEYKTQYLNGTLSKANFDGLVYKAFNSVKAEEKEEETPKVIMTAAEYKSMYMNYVKVLSLTYDNSSNGYYKMYENMAQYFLWNPYAKGGEGDELWYAQLLLETPSQSYKNRAALIEKIKAAFEQGLNFTADPDTCTDNDGNVYKYNSKTGKFELKE